MSEFGALQTALSGLLAHRRAIEVIGQNITNANTEGFTRRRIDLTPAGSSTGAAVWATNNGTGTGVDVAGVTRVREEFLDTKMRRQLGADGSASQLSDIMSQIENIVPEPSDTGIATQISELWGAFDDAAAHPDDLSVRSALLATANSLADTLNAASKSMTDLRTNLSTELNVNIAQVNADAARVAELNSSILAARASQSEPHDLEDQRDLIIDRLGKSVGATTRTQGDGTVDVFLGGSTLVRGDHADALKVVTGGTLDPPYNTMPLQKVDIRWVSDGYPATQMTGEVAGKLMGVNTLIPQYLNGLDGVASSLVTAVNAQHVTGHGLAATDVNLNFFDPTATTAADIAVSTDVAGQPSRIALAAGTAGALDGSLGHAIGALVDSSTGPDAIYRSYVGRLGVDTQSAVRRTAVATAMTNQFDQDRKASNGVSLDEEMTSLVATQRAYEASARVMTAVDQLLDQLISRTGMVGR